MTVRSPYQVQARTDPFWGERPPRGYSRTDRVDLNLFDAGHGDQLQATNPILLGMGVTIRLRLNVFVRVWKVFVREPGGTEVEITQNFVRVAPRMYELRGVAGAGVLNPESRASNAWQDAVRLDFRVVTQNITLEAVFRASMWVQDGDDLRSCGEPCQDDFEFLRLLGRQRVRLWRDLIEPTRQPRDTETDVMFFMFEVAQHFIDLSPEICAALNYYSEVMIGLKFFIVGDCEVAQFAAPPELPGANPWDEEIPTFQGQPLTLPMDWQDSGCP